MAMGAAMTGMRPVAEIMFSDFLACCWDYLANEIPKMRYMTGGQVTVPLVVRTANGGGLGFGAQHSQAVENWALAVPGLKVVAPSTPADVVGLLAAAVRSDDPVVFFEHKGLFASRGRRAAARARRAARPGRDRAAGHRRHGGRAGRHGADRAGRRRASWPPPAYPPRSSTCAAWCRWTWPPCWRRSPAPRGC